MGRAPLFIPFFALAFRPHHQKSSEPGPKTAKKNERPQAIISGTHPHPRAAKRLCLEGVKPLKLKTFTTLSAVFLKAQISQSETKKEAKMEASGMQNITNKNQKNEHPKTVKNKITKNSSESPLPETVWIVAPFLCHFWALGHPGTEMSPKSPPRAPRPNVRSMFDSFWTCFLWILTGQTLESLLQDCSFFALLFATFLDKQITIGKNIL